MIRQEIEELEEQKEKLHNQLNQEPLKHLDYEKICKDACERYDIKKMFVTGRKSDYGEKGYLKTTSAMD